MDGDVIITTEGIISTLKNKYTEKTFYKAIAEYIWNGFDAGATKVEVLYDMSNGGTFKLLKIIDNGHGINQSHLPHTFKPFHVSEKKKESNDDSDIMLTMHGKNGVGRFSFFTFARVATWDTVYREESSKYKYQIEIVDNKLEHFSGLEAIPEETNDPEGTTVVFSRFKRPPRIKKSKKGGSREKQMLDHLKNEFGWFMELKKPLGYKLLINGEELDYSDLIGGKDAIKIEHNGIVFDVRYIQWENQLDEYSKFYFLDNNYKLSYKENTTFNNQGDYFYHSVFISSDYFEDFSIVDTGNTTLSGGCRSDGTFKHLKEELETFLRIKRKPFLKEHAKTVIQSFEEEGIIDRKSKNEFELIQIDDLECVLSELYTTQPKALNGLKTEQKKILVGLFAKILISDEREEVISIIEQVVNLSPEEKKQWAEMLKLTDMSRINKMLNLLRDRYYVINFLKQIVFNENLGADEIHHLQKIVENHPWIFGEKYSLVAAAEDNFEKALQSHIYILRKDDKKVTIDHPNKQKQVDVFLCRQTKYGNAIHNLIIELKHPSKRIGMNELNQVKIYMETIREISQFNGDSYTWDFILAGTKFTTNRYIEKEIENSSVKGEPDLAYSVDNYKIYVKKWCDILNACELRHNFLQEKLEFDKNKLYLEVSSADEAVELSKQNSAGICSW
ncbi:ATP-binding protein [Methanolobus profundi]|uniref:Histidine kinase-, DNA gyrase B-, and HSP90-like ATPase n=1 Tax=Methanolobus profundi TaxID=487685 RepID=A0A1I4TVX4_9EURY|nr:ATP-binding protein [Methanolobus profundi]SFM80730.1 Histidine kinase-, DNA gyrase B-, and HSP90-like ATPase [Methanolobus profundi]